MEDPPQLAGPHIKAAHIPRRHLFHPRVVENRSSYNDDVAADHGRGTDPIEGTINRTAQTLRQIDAAVVAKRGDRLARIGVESDKLSSSRANENTFLIPIGPIR